LKNLKFERERILLLSEVASKLILEKIINNELKPGERLDIDQLAQLLEMSRTPVINALKELSQKGYVTIHSRSGSYVRAYSRYEMENIFDFREVMERLVVKKAADLADKNVLKNYKNRFNELCIKFEENHCNLDDFFKLEMEFHQYLMQLCPSVISMKLQDLVDLTKRIRKLHLQYLIERRGEKGVTKSELQIHLKLAEAIMNKDYQTADQLILDDISITKLQVLNLYDEIEAFGRLSE
jgi:DNA-binding GntR family transcriptional regulator